MPRLLIPFVRALGTLAVLGVALVTPARRGLAQQPLNIGTATALGLGGMTEARFAAAALWNPGLAAIFDGPMRSFGLLAVQLEPGPLRQTYDVFTLGHRLQTPTATLGANEQDALLGWLHGEPVGRLSTTIGVQWIGLHSRDLLVSLTSYDYEAVVAPGRAVRIFAGDSLAQSSAVPLSVDEVRQAQDLVSRRARATVLAVAKGKDYGILPLLGRTWAGLTVKGGYVHQNVVGHFQFEHAALMGSDPTCTPSTTTLPPGASDAYGAAYCEVSVQGTKLYAADLGVASSPVPSLLLSVTFANLYQKAIGSVKPTDLVARRLAATGIDDAGRSQTTYTEGTLDVADTAAWKAYGHFAARSAHFMPVIRMGAALDTRAGRFLVGYARPTDHVASIDHDAADRISIGYQGLRGLRPRLSYSERFDGTRVLAVGFQRGQCADRTAVGLSYLVPPSGTASFGISLSWSRGDPPCGVYR